jgi:16S rRNA (guanine527-N7)-methyltransferase
VENKGKLLDIGTGAGFPGVPIKLLNDKLSVTLIDAVNKKLNVIRDVSKDMNINNLEIIHSRAEDLARDKDYREQYDYVTTRAVSNLSTILEYMIPFLKVNGIAICMKGPNYKEEIEEAKNTFKVLGIKLKEVKKYVFEGQERNVLIIEKLKKTDEKFPRGGGKPLKEPLK